MLCEGGITTPEQAMTGEEIASCQGRAYNTIRLDLAALYYHLRLLEKTDPKARGKAARYYVPERIRKRKKRLAPVLRKFEGQRVIPERLKEIFKEEIEPITEYTYADLLDDGYRVTVEETEHKTLKVPNIDVDVYSDQGEVNAGAWISFQAIKQTRTVWIEHFHPNFPMSNTRLGMGRALLRYLLSRPEYAGYHVISDASDQLQRSFLKMHDYNPIADLEGKTVFERIGEGMLTEMENGEGISILAQNQKLYDYLQYFWKSANVHGIVPGIPYTDFMYPDDLDALLGTAGNFQYRYMVEMARLSAGNAQDQTAIGLQYQEFSDYVARILRANGNTELLRLSSDPAARDILIRLLGILSDIEGSVMSEPSIHTVMLEFVNHPEGSPWRMYSILTKTYKGRFARAESVRRITRGRMRDGGLSIETVRRDLNTLVYLGLVHKEVRIVKDKKEIYYKASGLSPPKKGDNIKTVLKSLGARPKSKEKRAAKAKLAYNQNVVPVVTPVIKKGTEIIIDREGIKRLIDHLLSIGVKSVLVMGATGEFMDMPNDKRMEAIRIFAEASKGRLTIFANATGNSAGETEDNVRAIEGMPHINAIVLAPLYYLNNNYEIIPHIRKIKDEINPGLPLVLYNNPGIHKVNGKNISLGIVNRLRSDILAIKDSSGDKRILKGYAGVIRTFQGDEARIIEALEAGADGSVSSMGNCLDLPQSIYAAPASGRGALQARISDNIPAMTAGRRRIPAALKYYLRVIGVLASDDVVRDEKALTVAEKTAIISERPDYAELRKQVFDLLGHESYASEAIYFDVFSHREIVGKVAAIPGMNTEFAEWLTQYAASDMWLPGEISGTLRRNISVVMPFVRSEMVIRMYREMGGAAILHLLKPTGNYYADLYLANNLMNRTHSNLIKYGDNGLLIKGMCNVGKSSTSYCLVNMPGASYRLGSDDWPHWLYDGSKLFAGMAFVGHSWEHEADLYSGRYHVRAEEGYVSIRHIFILVPDKNVRRNRCVEDTAIDWRTLEEAADIKPDVDAEVHVIRHNIVPPPGDPNFADRFKPVARLIHHIVTRDGAFGELGPVPALNPDLSPDGDRPKLAHGYKAGGVALGAAVGWALLPPMAGVPPIVLALGISFAAFLVGWGVHELGHWLGGDFGRANTREMRAGPLASLYLCVSAGLAACVISMFYPQAFFFSAHLKHILLIAAANYYIHIFADRKVLFRSGANGDTPGFRAGTGQGLQNAPSPVMVNGYRPRENLFSMEELYEGNKRLFDDSSLGQAPGVIEAKDPEEMAKRGEVFLLRLMYEPLEGENGRPAVTTVLNRWKYETEGIRFNTTVKTDSMTARANAAEFCRHLEGLDELPGRIVVEEWGVGTGRYAADFLDYIKERSPEYYGRIMYVLIDFSDNILERASKSGRLRRHAGHTALVRWEEGNTSEYGRRMDEIGAKALLVRHNEFFDDLPGQEILYIDGKYYRTFGLPYIEKAGISQEKWLSFVRGLQSVISFILGLSGINWAPTVMPTGELVKILREGDIAKIRRLHPGFLRRIRMEKRFGEIDNTGEYPYLALVNDFVRYVYDESLKQERRVDRKVMRFPLNITALRHFENSLSRVAENGYVQFNDYGFTAAQYLDPKGEVFLPYCDHLQHIANTWTFNLNLDLFRRLARERGVDFRIEPQTTYLADNYPDRKPDEIYFHNSTRQWQRIMLNLLSYKRVDRFGLELALISARYRSIFERDFFVSKSAVLADKLFFVPLLQLGYTRDEIIKACFGRGLHDCRFWTVTAGTAQEYPDGAFTDSACVNPADSSGPQLEAGYKAGGILLGIISGGAVMSGGFFANFPLALSVSVAAFLVGWGVHEFGHWLGGDFGRANTREMRAGPIASFILFSASSVCAMIVNYPYSYVPLFNVPLYIYLAALAGNTFIHIFADKQAFSTRNGMMSKR
ncbi:MAG: SAM-dependent methyltransferase [Candidatus Omnitrophota bacterium]